MERNRYLVALGREYAINQNRLERATEVLNCRDYLSVPTIRIAEKTLNDAKRKLEALEKEIRRMVKL